MEISTRSWSPWVLPPLGPLISNLLIVHTRHDIFTLKKKSLNAIVVKELRVFCCSLQMAKLLWGKCFIQYEQRLHRLRADEENALAVSVVFKGS